MSPGPSKSFDPDEVVVLAMRKFWKSGYAATTLSELREVTGLGSKSLYDTFGNKQSLYAASILKYRNSVIASMYDQLDRGESPLAAIHQLLDTFSEDNPAALTLGCLVGVGMAQVDPSTETELAGLLHEQVRYMAACLTDALQAAFDEGELRDEIPASQLAALIVTSLQGLLLVGRTNPRSIVRSDALDAIHTTLDALRVTDTASRT
jgi:TetR/AcrR family transcriptional repressor of nem operon